MNKQTAIEWYINAVEVTQLFEKYLLTGVGLTDDAKDSANSNSKMDANDLPLKTKEMSKQTALQILVESMTTSDVSFYSKEIAIALQMEREQIEEAFNVYGTYAEAAEYFDEIYGGNNE
jgi:hypothetical protein